jgi:hypothetical protein
MTQTVYAVNYTFTDAVVSITSLKTVILGSIQSMKRKNTNITNDDRPRTSEVCCPKSPKQKKS